MANYQILALILWVVFSILAYFLTRKWVVREFGSEKSRFKGLDWREYLIAVAGIGALFSVALTFLIRAIA